MLTRGAAFFVFASASWALLPLIVRQELQRGPSTYGLFLACLGVGAIGGALLLPRLLARLSRDRIVAGATVLYAIAMLALAHSGNVYAAGAAMLLTGVGVDLRRIVTDDGRPDRPAGLGAGTRPGALLGRLHGRHGGRQRDLGAGRVMDRHSLCTHAYLPSAPCSALPRPGDTASDGHDADDRSPSLHWPPRCRSEEVESRPGPVMVTVEYRIDPCQSCTNSAALMQKDAQDQAARRRFHVGTVQRH